MLLITRRVIVMMSLLLVATIYAQEQTTRDSINPVLQNKIELMVKAEKELMKEEIIKVNEHVKNNEISKEEVRLAKIEIANRYALSIKEKTNSIVSDSKISKNNDIQVQFYGTKLFKIIKRDDSIKNKPRKKDFRTYSGIVMAYGFNNTIQKGKSLKDSDYKLSSGFFELGFAWKTRVFKESNWLRLGYGLSLQYNSLKPKDNQYFVRNKNVTSLQVHPYNLRKSKFRTANLVVPVSLEFGTSEKIDKGDYSIFSPYQKLKFTIGGYFGIRIETIQKVKYNVDGDREEDQKRSHYNMNDFVYGITTGIAYNGIGLYMKYDLNPLFSSPNTKQNSISLGLKCELF